MVANAMTGTLTEALRGLGDEFRPNRLAYLSLMTKNEREMCNALAWRLNEVLAGEAENPGHPRVETTRHRRVAPP